jgi:hypothetical protein
MYKELTEIFPYLISIRKLENYLSLDIEFPSTWKLPKKFVNPESTVELTSTKPDLRCFSFAVQFDEKQIKQIFENVIGIISWNKERELKEKLLQDKFNELKTMFEKNSLDSLKNLQFNIQKDISKLKLEDETEDSQLVSYRDEEGQD